MRRVRCHECGKLYDYDVDDFCPRCGAFTQPAKSTAINAEGSVVRVDGINENNHTGSFVHRELHEENRERKRMGLSKGVRRMERRPLAANDVTGRTQKSRGSGRKNVSPARIVFILIAVVFGFQILSGFLSLLLFW